MKNPQALSLQIAKALNKIQEPEKCLESLLFTHTLSNYKFLFFILKAPNKQMALLVVCKKVEGKNLILIS